VSRKIEKSGGVAVVNADESVSIIMDGNVQEVIPADDRRILSGSTIKKND
jgi:hypothetical protein